MSKDEKTELSRRGFLGAIGAVGAAAAIPLSWARDKPLEAAIEQSVDGEVWEPHSGSIRGYFKGSGPQVEIDGTKFDLYNYSIDFSANIIECETIFDDFFATKGLNELEVECSFLGVQGAVEAMKWDNKTRHIVIDTGEYKFEFDGYPKGVQHQYPPGQEYILDGNYNYTEFLSSVTFVAAGEIKRCLK